MHINLAPPQNQTPTSPNLHITSIQEPHIPKRKPTFPHQARCNYTVSLSSLPCRSSRMSRKRSSKRASYSISLSSSDTRFGTSSLICASIDAIFRKFAIAGNRAVTEPRFNLSLSNQPTLSSPKLHQFQHTTDFTMQLSTIVTNSIPTTIKTKTSGRRAEQVRTSSSRAHPMLFP
jgi:hypothetical protein